jgi:lysozyme
MIMVNSAQGLDVSNYQGRFNWAGAEKSVPDLSFGIYRLSQGLGSIDPDAGWNHDHIKAAGLEHGAYHFLDPAESGAAQANHFVTLHSSVGLTSTDILFLDNETAGKSAAATATVALDFMTELDKLAPHNPRGVYTFIDFAKYGYCAGLESWPLWLAFPALKAPVPPMPWTSMMFWQWGQRNGVDADAFMGTRTELTRWIESFQATSPAKPQAHRMTGLKTMAQVALDLGTTVPDMVMETARHKPGGFGAGEKALLNHLADVHPVPGTELWA